MSVLKRPFRCGWCGHRMRFFGNSCGRCYHPRPFYQRGAFILVGAACALSLAAYLAMR